MQLPHSLALDAQLLQRLITEQYPKLTTIRSPEIVRGTIIAMANWINRLSSVLIIAAIAAVCAFSALSGCRKSHVGNTALPPTMRGPIKDLTGIRVGDDVSLNWTTPRNGMRKYIVDGSVRMRVCRLESPDSKCVEAGHSLLLAPGAVGTFAEELPTQMGAGAPRVAYYSVEILNRSGIGVPNQVPILIGSPPPLVQGLTAETSDKGAVLRWTPEPVKTPGGETIIRVRRAEGPPTVATQAMRDGLVPFDSRPEVELSATDASASVIDPKIHEANTYRYRAQRVFRVVVDGQTLEMDGQFSPEVQITLPIEGRP